MQRLRRNLIVSSQNVAEAHVVTHIARKFNDEQKSFWIITPYDAQRHLLETELRAAKLPWEDKCFNVDSFQSTKWLVSSPLMFHRPAEL